MIRLQTSDYETKIFETFNSGWALLTAGDYNNRNSMTVSWGFMGTLWGKNVICVFVRPTRYTFNLMEKSERFTLSFMDESYKGAMKIMGTKSGRDTDKYKESGFVPVYDTDSGVSYIKNANVVFKCKKLYADFFKKECLFDESILKQYKEDLSDMHKFYIAEVTSILVDESYEG